MHDEVIVLGPGEGRAYEIGPMRGVFKADHEDYCASEWSVEPGCDGPGAHSHPEQIELFLVTEGTMSFLVGDEWLDAPAGTFLRIPAGVTHDFRNRTDAPARAYNVFIPGNGFEASFASWTGG
jgi:mannose-6-phosphate isomerase-like protein (cupin superfamily)